MAASAEGHGPLGMAFAARAYVEHVRGLWLREAAVAAELAAAREGAIRAQSLAPSAGGGPQHGDDAVFSIVSRAGELQRERDAAAAELAGERAEFGRCLSEVPDPRHRALLSMRADGATWEEVAAALSVSRRTAFRIGDGAYVSLWAAMPEPWRRLVFPDAAE